MIAEDAAAPKPRRETLGEKAHRLAASNQAMGLLAAVSIAESAILPLPVDAVALPMMAAARERIPLIVLVGAITSLIGGILGYLVGMFAFEFIGQPIIAAFNQQAEFAQLRSEFNADWLNGAWIIFLGAVTPIPFKLVCLGAGAMAYPFWIFLPVALFGRVLRFAAFGVIFWFAGPAAAELLKKHAKVVGVVMIVIIALGFAATSFLLPKG